MIKQASKFLAAGGVILLAACGGGDGGPSFEGEIDAATMEGMADNGFYVAYDIANSMLEGEPSADIPLAPARAGGTPRDQLIEGIFDRAARRSGRDLPMTGAPRFISSVCEPTETGIDEFGDWIDTDADGVPDDYTLNFGSNCTEVSGDWTYTYSGSLRFRDQAGLFGYRMDISNLRFRGENTVLGEIEQTTVSGFERGLYTASGITHDADLTNSFFLRFDDAPAAPGLMTTAPVDVNFSFIWEEASSYDPEGTISLDAPIPSGDLSIDMEFRILASVTGEGSANFRFNLTTPTVLHYENTSCYGFDSGSLRGEMNGDGTIYFLITWTGCDVATFEYGGTTETPVAISAR